MWIFIKVMVVFMTVQGFAYSEDFDRFNSSLLIEVTRPNGVFTCTGVAVSRETVVTAAHCLDGKVLKVRIFTGSKYDPKAPSLEIKDFKLHPNYDPKRSQYSSDVAKIHMKKPLPSEIRLYPIFEGTSPQGDFYRFGFGARDKKNIRTVVTPNLRRVNFSEGVVELNDTFSKSGDSGGPIYLTKGKDTYILAVHSTFSYGPQGQYSYNPLLGQYLSWIYSN